VDCQVVRAAQRVVGSQCQCRHWHQPQQFGTSSARIESAAPSTQRSILITVVSVQRRLSARESVSSRSPHFLN
jgi:hypothetical protein